MLKASILLIIWYVSGSKMKIYKLQINKTQRDFTSPINKYNLCNFCNKKLILKKKAYQSFTILNGTLYIPNWYY